MPSSFQHNKRWTYHTPQADAFFFSNLLPTTTRIPYIHMYLYTLVCIHIHINVHISMWWRLNKCQNETHFNSSMRQCALTLCADVARNLILSFVQRTFVELKWKVSLVLFITDWNWHFCYARLMTASSLVCSYVCVCVDLCVFVIVGQLCANIPMHICINVLSCGLCRFLFAIDEIRLFDLKILYIYAMALIRNFQLSWKGELCK